MKAVLAAAVVLAVLLSGCSSGDGGSAQSPETPTTSARKIVSTVVKTVTLPPGTTISSHSDGVEIWKTSGSQDEAVAALKPQFPIGRPLDGSPWCAERTDPKTGSLDWRWAGPSGSVDVNFGTDGSVRMERIAGAATCGA